MTSWRRLQCDCVQQRRQCTFVVLVSSMTTYQHILSSDTRGFFIGVCDVIVLLSFDWIDCCNSTSRHSKRRTSNFIFHLKTLQEQTNKWCKKVNRSVARFLFILSPYGRVLRLIDAQVFLSLSFCRISNLNQLCLQAPSKGLRYRVARVIEFNMSITSFFFKKRKGFILLIGQLQSCDRTYCVGSCWSGIIEIDSYSYLCFVTSYLIDFRWCRNVEPMQMTSIFRTIKTTRSLVTMTIVIHHHYFSFGIRKILNTRRIEWFATQRSSIHSRINSISSFLFVFDKSKKYYSFLFVVIFRHELTALIM